MESLRIYPQHGLDGTGRSTDFTISSKEGKLYLAWDQHTLLPLGLYHTIWEKRQKYVLDQGLQPLAGRSIRRPNTSDTKANWRLRLYWKMGNSPPTPASATERHRWRHSQFQGVMKSEDTKFLRTALWEINPHSENEVWPQGFKPRGAVYVTTEQTSTQLV